MLHLSLYKLVTASTNIKSFGQTIKVARLSNTAVPVASADEFDYFRKSAETINLICRDIGMPVTAAQARKILEIVSEVDGPALSSDSYLSRSVEDACARLADEFREECLERIAVVIAPEMATTYRQPEPLFGDAVSLKFAKVAEDIAEAGKCLALERPTACVFHLMRVVEYSVQRLGKKLQVRIDVEKEGWYQIILHVNKAVDALPSQTSRQRKVKQAYGAAAAHLNSVRIATRNDVMHPKATYTDEEAQTLMDATKLLMQQLAKII